MNGAGNLSYAGIMLIAGMSVPVMAAMSGGIGVRVGNPSFATASVFGIAFLVTAAAAVAWGLPRLGQVASVPPYLYLGGVCVAFYGSRSPTSARVSGSPMRCSACWWGRLSPPP